MKTKVGAKATLRVRRKDGTLTDGRPVKNYAAIGNVSTSPTPFMHGGPYGTSSPTTTASVIAYAYEDVSAFMRPARAGETVNIVPEAQNAWIHNELVRQTGDTYMLQFGHPYAMVYALENGERLFGVGAFQSTTTPAVFHEDYLGGPKDAKPAYPSDQQVCQYYNALYTYTVRNTATLAQEVSSPETEYIGSRGDNIIGFPVGAGTTYSLSFAPATEAYKCYLLVFRCSSYVCYFWLIDNPIEIGVGDSLQIDDLSIEFHRMPVQEFAVSPISGITSSGRFFFADQRHTFDRDDMVAKNDLGIIQTANALSFPAVTSIDDGFSIDDLGGNASTVHQWITTDTVPIEEAESHGSWYFDRFSKGTLFATIPAGGFTDVKQLVICSAANSSTSLYFIIEFDTPQTLAEGKILSFNFEAYSDAFDPTDTDAFQFPFFRDTDFPPDYPVDWSTKW